MPDQLLADVMPALGLQFRRNDGYFVSTAAVIRGQILEVDSSHSNAASTTALTGDTASGDAVAVTATDDAAIGGRQLLVALTGCPRAGMKFRGILQGDVYILLFGLYSAGARVIIQPGGDTIDGKRIFAIVLEDGGMADMATYARCVWDGELGFGQFVGATVPGGGDDPVYPADDIEIGNNPPGGPDPGGGPEGPGSEAPIRTVGVVVQF